MKQNKFITILLLLFFLVGFSATSAEQHWQFFRINAQYRGAVKKSFRNIGCALAWFNDISPGKTQVITHVCAVNPDKKGEIFSFRLNLLLGNNPNSVWVTDQVYAEFKKVTGQRQNEVKQLVCLWDHIRRQASRSNPVSGVINVAGKIIDLSEKTRRNSREITCSWSGRRGFSGKFFLKKSGENGWMLEKFRFKSGKVAISLVQDTGEAISKDFRYKEPFAKIVFDNK